MASEQLSALNGEEMPEEQTKPSFMKKVKAKARKLKSKMTSHDGTQASEDQQHPAAYSPRDVRQEEYEDESDTSESEEEGGNKYNMPYTALGSAAKTQQQSPAGATAPKAEGNSFKAPASAQSNYGGHSKPTADEKFPLDPVVLKNGGPAGTEQAVPTNYSYFNANPSEATLPSDHNTSQRQRDIPSSLGGESAGITPSTEKLSKETRNQFADRDASLSKSGDKESELPRSFMSSQNAGQKDDSGLAQSSQPALGSSLESQSLEQDSGVQEASHALTPHNSMSFTEWSGSTAPKQTAETFPISESAADGSDDGKSHPSSQGQALGLDTTGAAEGVKDTSFNSTSDNSTENSANLPSKDGEQKPIASRVTDTAYGLKNAVASQLGYADQTMSSDSTPISQKATDSAVQGKDYGANVLGSADQGLSSDEKPISAKVSEATTQAKEGVEQKTTTPDQQDKTLTDSIMGLPGMLSSKLGFGGGSPTASSPTSASPAQQGSSFKEGPDTPVESTPNSGLISQDSSTRKDTPYPDQSSTTTAPGLFDRVSGIASSLFSGGAAKQPTTTTEEEKSASLERKSI